MLKLLLSLYTCALVSLCWSQKVVVEGTVRDTSNELLELVSVTCAEQPKAFAFSNTSGFYSISLDKQDEVSIIFSYQGEQEVRKVKLLSDRVLFDVLLDFSKSVGTATVASQSDRDRNMKPLQPRVIERIPSPGQGIEALLTQAFVNQNNELSASYSVRGGSFDENLVYVNGIQVYRPFLVRAGEQEGLSFPNPAMVENIDFSAGGFEAKFGDRLSSVLDIQYKRPKEFGGSFMASFLGGSFQFEGADSTQRFTHNTGIRYKSNSYLLGSLDTQGDYRPNYTDLQTYLTYDITDLWEISFLGNYSRNLYNFVPATRETNLGTINEALRFSVFFEGQEVSSFETFFGAITNSYRVSPSTRLRLINSVFNTYEQETFDIKGSYFLDELERDPGSDEFGEVLRNRGVGQFLNHARNELNATVINVTFDGITKPENSSHLIQYGVQWQQQFFEDKLSEWDLVDSSGFSTPHPPDNVGEPGSQDIIGVNDLIKATNFVDNQMITGFAQDTYEWTTDSIGEWKANLGARFNYRSLNGQLVGGPRGSISYHKTWEKQRKRHDNNQDTTIVKDVVWRLSGGYYWQPPFFKELRGVTGLVNPEVRAQRAIHAVLGADLLFTAYDRPFKLIVEAYYKDLNNLVPYELENVRLRYFGENLSSGYATGLDMMVNGEFIKNVQSWIKLSFLSTAEDLRNDDYYMFFNDDGVEIVQGFTLNDVATDSTLISPGLIPRPTDQRVNFSMFFQDRMKRWPKYSVQMVLHYGTGLPYGPPDFERYKDVARTTSYKRVDLGFVRDIITPGITAKRDNFFTRNVEESFISLEVFNLVNIRNTINHTWIQDVNGRLYSVPNFLTGRRINLKWVVKF